MDETFGDLLRATEQSPSYWMQVALLEFLQSLDAMRESRGGLSRKELADLVGVSPATLSRWLSGNENITVSTMCRLATALGAAVHIHVADNKEKGRWRPEVGMARAGKGDMPQGAPSTLGDFSAFRARRKAQATAEILGTSTTEAQNSGSMSADASYPSTWRRAHG
jgi:transcriptional regulator with XRE-family HTH domain